MMEGVKLARPAVNKHDSKHPGLAQGQRLVLPLPSVAGAKYRILVKYSESTLDFMVFASALKESSIMLQDLGSFLVTFGSCTFGGSFDIVLTWKELKKSNWLYCLGQEPVDYFNSSQ